MSKGNRKGKRQPSIPSSVSPRGSRTGLYTVILLAALAFGVYANSLGNGFVYDDQTTIVENRFIRDPANIATFFSPEYFRRSGEVSYRPVATLTYFFCYALGGLKPFPYHFLTVALHALNAVISYLLLRHLFPGRRLLAFVAPALFAVHPALTEAVNCVSYNEDVLALTFLLCALLLHRQDRLLPRVAAPFVYLLALFAKEMAITLPAVALAIDIVLREGRLPERVRALRTRVVPYAGYAFVATLYLLFRFRWMVSPKEAMGTTYGDLATRVLYLPHNLLVYLKLMAWPLALNADRMFAYPGAFFSPFNLLAIIVLIVLVVFLFRTLLRDPIVFLGLAWLLITLGPVYNIIQISNPIAERYLYIPLLGFCILLARLLEWAGERLSVQRPGQAALVGAVALIAFYAPVTVARNRIWRDEYSLWSETVRVSPTSPRAHNNYGLALKERGERDRALAEFELAVRIRPDYAEARNNLGSEYSAMARFAEAEREFGAALAEEPEHAEACYNLGNLYRKQGLWEKAAALYRRTITLDPQHSEAHNNLGLVYDEQGKAAEALAEYERAVALDCANVSARNNLAISYARSGRLPEAVAEYGEILRVRPDYIDARANLAITLTQMGRRAEARAEWQRVLALAPDHQLAREQLK